MDGVKHRVAVCARVLEKDGRFAVLIYHDGGASITRSNWFQNKNDAAKAGAEILDYGVYQMKEYAADVFGGGNETPQDPTQNS